MKAPLSALCVGRHRFLSDHLGLYFTNIGLRTQCVVGLDEALVAVRAAAPDVVICEYDLLATIPLEAWEHDAAFERVPVIAVSLTRRPEEMHLLDVNGIGGFLYLPTLDPEAALRVLEMTRRAAEYTPARGFPRSSSAPSPS
jgi:DNA-binding NarL/FixJ family response regulator